MTGTERIRPTAADELTYVVDPEAVCPPSAGGRAAPVMWSDTIPVVVERTCLGVRADSDELGASLREALAPYVRDDLETRPQANLSVVVADDRGHRRGAGFHFLRRGTTAVVRSRDPRRVLAGLASYLSAATEPPDGVVRVNAAALVRDGAATVVPAQTLQWLAEIDRRLATNGPEFADQPWVYLDAGRGEVVVPPPWVTLATAAVDRIVSSVADRRPDPGVAPGRYPLRAWAYFSQVPDRPASRAEMVAQAVCLCPDAGRSSPGPAPRVVAGVMTAAVPSRCRGGRPPIWSRRWSAPDVDRPDVRTDDIDTDEIDADEIEADTIDGSFGHGACRGRVDPPRRRVGPDARRRGRRRALVGRHRHRRRRSLRRSRFHRRDRRRDRRGRARRPGDRPRGRPHVGPHARTAGRARGVATESPFDDIDPRAGCRSDPTSRRFGSPTCRGRSCARRASPARHLLVAWSPGCGYCVQLAPDLARAGDTLRRPGSRWC